MRRRPKKCFRAAAQSLKLRSADEQVAVPGAPDAQMCWGAFLVLHSLTGFVDAALKPVLGACVPDGSTLTQLVAIFVEYVDRNPAARSQPFARVAINAINRTFPCAKKSA